MSVHCLSQRIVRTDSEDGQIPVFVVSLEGPIAWTDEDGVSSPSHDSIRLKEFAGEFTARRFAAKIAYSFGLHILDTTGPMTLWVTGIAGRMNSDLSPTLAGTRIPGAGFESLREPRRGLAHGCQLW